MKYKNGLISFKEDEEHNEILKTAKSITDARKLRDVTQELVALSLKTRDIEHQLGSIIGWLSKETTDLPDEEWVAKHMSNALLAGASIPFRWDTIMTIIGLKCQLYAAKDDLRGSS